MTLATILLTLTKMLNLECVSSRREFALSMS